jgi:5-formyltetrahydrofolate cyclo-ligase
MFHQHTGGDLVQPNRFGIREPLPSANILVPTLNDAVLIPCLAVTAPGQRLGHGFGYYDRYLSALASKPVVIAVTFERVVCSPRAWDVESHDVTTDWICTELGIRPKCLSTSV